MYGLVLHPPADYVSGDMAGYVQRAVHLAGGGRVPRGDFFMPVGTQLLLSLPLRVVGTGRSGLWAASILWCALSCLYPWLAWKWAGALLSPRAAAITAAGCAMSPLAIIYGGYFSSELPATVALPAALWAVSRCVTGVAVAAGAAGAAGAEPRRPTRPMASIPAGLVAGAAVTAVLVVRQQFALNLAIVGVPLVAGLRHRAGRVVSAAMAAGAVAAVGVVVVLGAAPWRVAGGLPPLFGQNGGVNFFYGHCDARILTVADHHFESPVRAQAHTGTDIAIPTRHAADQTYFYARGWDCVVRRPVRAVVLVGRSLADMTATSVPFPPWTDGGAVLAVAELANTTACLLGLLLVVAAMRRMRDDPLARHLVGHLACAFVAAAAFVGEPRYRIPYDLFGFALAGWWAARRRA